MSFSDKGGVPFTHPGANFSELADEAKASADKIINENGESYVALIDDAHCGLNDVLAGRTQDAGGSD